MVKKILVVDDEENIRKLIETRLKANQYNVITASNGAEALEKAESEAPDLILLDIMMPELDGLEVLRKLKSKFETSSIPVIMLTGKMDTGTILSAQDLEAKDYIIKPFEPQELLNLIKKYIEF
ncbi:MAG: hypothetical protein A2Y00_02780 [Omnitrophica WOR_2 bacterium GWF2_43_52]|nr:MAG: hypothetical protein A2062_04790 [Omnitrophica WOR_2 bacterium GWA2_44_7]OGX22362.1 MAG: hypothetical protein A2Y00_02780 [Omnitrophica WOR_2 bacterium GWF2_43_52]OGX54600.1 MAG: hypothetical protein A2460_05460 [Omnitrophica WOR_2 bacterium RIFOXYC2_FULL_43_9]HAH20773.1 hypothetical protein [Candidatus Omnitrophota bacterium]HBG64444.1 hypothetical protein [Candidatus Omnitrophota bacterium]